MVLFSDFFCMPLLLLLAEHLLFCIRTYFRLFPTVLLYDATIVYMHVSSASDDVVLFLFLKLVEF